MPFKGRLYVRDPHRSAPEWAAFVQQALSSRLEKLENATTAAVLFVEASKRVFAFLFGYGRSLLLPDSFESDFGLRVALNTVNPDHLRSVDVRTLEELTFYTRRQASRSSAFETFGLDVTADLLRGVTGRPHDSKLATRLTGSDSLTLHSTVSVRDLGSKCSALLTAYRGKAYRKRFSFIDHLQTVRDPAVRQVLDDKLLVALRKGETGSIYLAAPVPLDWQHLSGICYSTDKTKAVHEDLDLDDYLKLLPDQSALTLADLGRHSVETQRAAGGPGDDTWSVYSCIAYEVEWKNRLYSLTGGDWFRIAKDFAEEVSTFIKDIDVATALPSSHAGEYEETYNARVAGADNSFLLLDQQTVTGSVGRGGIEPCDLLTNRGRFIHVKRKTRSATLSHLFGQGTVSAEAFLSDEVFRTKLKDLVTKLAPAFGSLVPTGRPDSSKYEVTYAIVTGRPTDVPSKLPFFSQLHLMQAVERLRLLGYKASVCGVQQEVV